MPYKIQKISVLNTQKYLSYLMRNLENSEELPSEFMLNKPHRIIKDSLATMYKKDMKFNSDDLCTLCMEKGYDSNSVMEDVKNIYNCFDKSVDDNIEFVKQKVRDFHTRYYIQNDLYQKLVIESDSKDELIDIDNLEAIKDELEQKINNLRGRQIELKSTKDLSKEYSTYIKRRDSGEIPKRIIGLAPVDKLFKGYTCDAGEMSILAGLTGSSKSIFCKNIEKNLIAKKVPVLSINLEMSQNRTMDRLASMYSGLQINRVVDSDKTTEEQSRLTSFMRQFSKYDNYRFTDSRGMNLSDLEKSVRQAREEFLDIGVMTKKDDYMFVTVDLLKMLDEFSGERWETVEKAVDRLHAISHPDKLNFHLLGVAQALDDILERGKKLFKDPSDIDYFKIDHSMIEGGKIFRTRARAIYTLVRPLYMKKRFFPERMEEWEVEKRDIVNVHLSKSNNSESGFWKYTFDPNFRMREFKEDPLENKI